MARQALENKINEARALEDDEYEYSSETWAILETEILAVEVVLTNDKATLEDIEGAINAISGAISGLGIIDRNN